MLKIARRPHAAFARPFAPVLALSLISLFAAVPHAYAGDPGCQPGSVQFKPPKAEPKPRFPGWFGAPAGSPSAAPEAYGFDTGFETSDDDGYNTTDTIDLKFAPDDIRTTAPGALYAFGSWDQIFDGDISNDRFMQTINNGFVDNNAATANGGTQSIRVNGVGIGAQSAGYGDDWDGLLDMTGGSVSMSIDMRVTNADATTPGLWGLTLFAASDSNGTVESFGGIGFAGGELFLFQDSDPQNGVSLGAANYDEWMTLGLDFDFATRTFNASIDGVIVATEAFNPNAVSNIVGFSTFGQASSAGTTESANFDNYSITLVGTPVAVPEAGTLPLAALGSLLTLGGIARARRRKTA